MEGILHKPDEQKEKHSTEEDLKIHMSAKGRITERFSSNGLMLPEERYSPRPG